jgi:hypothetical protein
MSPAADSLEMAATKKALKLACDAGDLAGTLAALATITRLVRLQYTLPPGEARVLTSFRPTRQSAQ